MRRDSGTSTYPETASMQDAVRRVQHEMLRVAFLLTGDVRHATALAESGILSALERADAAESWSTLRYDAMLAAGQDRLSGNFHRPASDATSAPASGQRYRVDDERSRMGAALDMLSDTERVALVLHDYAAIAVQDLRPLALAPGDEQLRKIIDETRARVSERAGLDELGRLHGALARFSVDAPNHDLWPDLEGPARAIAGRSRRKRRRAAIGIAGVSMALLLVFVAWWLGGDGATTGQEIPGELADVEEPAEQPRAMPSPEPAATATATPARRPLAERIGAELPGGFLLFRSESDARSGSTSESLVAFEPGSRDARLVWPSADQRFLAPDGRWALLGQRETQPDGDGSTRTVYRFWAAGPDGSRSAWDWTSERQVERVAIRDGLATLVLSDPAQHTLRLVQLDLTTGVETAWAEVSPGDPDASASRGDAMQLSGWIFAPPGSDELFLIGTRYEWNGMGTFVGYVLSVYALDRETLAPRLVTERVQTDTTRTASSITGEIALSEAHLLPDGSGIYAWHPATPDERASVRILDFASGEVEVVDAPFSSVIPAGPGRQTGVAAVPSNGGDRLFLIAANSREAAIVDLNERSIEQYFPIDLGEFPDARLGAADIALSFDGGRLYILESAPYPVAPRDVVPTRSTIWVLDLHQWRVIDQWELPTPVWTLLPAPDNGRLFVSAPVLANDRHRQNSPDVVGERLLALDTGTGEVVAEYRADELLSPDYGTARFSNWLVEYREGFARTPSVAGNAPGDPADFATLPNVELSDGMRGLPVDTLLSLDVRLIDPLSGRPVETDVVSEAVLSLILTHNEHNPVIALPSRIDAGVYRATLSLPASGWWDARLVVDGERSWSVGIDDALYGAPTVEGSDGRDYYLALDVDGPFGRPSTRVQVGAQWLDAASGVALPEGVTLPDGLPESLYISVAGANEGVRAGLDVPVMRPVAHGGYVARGELWGPGPWAVAIRLVDSDGGLRQIGGGRIEIAPPT